MCGGELQKWGSGEEVLSSSHPEICSSYCINHTHVPFKITTWETQFLLGTTCFGLGLPSPQLPPSRASQVILLGSLVGPAHHSCQDFYEP